MVDFLASQPHYADHLTPIWHALPPELRGRFHATPDARGRVIAAGIVPAPPRVERSGALLVVAGYRDYRGRARRPVVFAEHGAGQTYGGDDPHYAGGRGRAGVVLMLVPNEAAAERNRQAWPDTPCEVVGCPKLDAWHHYFRFQPENAPVVDSIHESTNAHNQARMPALRPTVAVSFHWDCKVAPESRWAWPHYKAALPSLAGCPDWDLIGHSHPRAWRLMRYRYREAGVERVPSFDEVVRRADVYVCDNSSTLYEFASLDRPVVVLDAPWYRTSVEHGLRFWRYADVGVRIQDPADLADAVQEALDDRPRQRQMRAEAVRAAYSFTDGRCAERAAQAIIEMEALRVGQSRQAV